MRFSVLALDYDGTIAHNGALNPDVRAAIAEARADGIAVVLVSGRILADLKQVAGSLDFVDAVVAENGAVLAFANGHSRVLRPQPPATFLHELLRRGIPFSAGECVVETDAGYSCKILDVIREQQLPLALLFNRGRLMVLPQAVSKATGLQACLRAWRLSVHNAIAIGDAENDHDLLAACELGVAVSWGSPALQLSADEVLRGDGPRSVAGYIRQAVKSVRLPPTRIGRRHQLSLGTTENGDTVALSVRGRNLLITGDPRSGKSWATGLLCEQLILQGYCVWVIDPEGDYVGLESLPGVVVLGGGRLPPRLRDLARALRYPDVSVVVDLSHVASGAKLRYLKLLLSMLASLRRATGLPHRIVVDEAHYFLHDPTVSQVLDLDLGAYTLVTYRPSDLDLEVRKAMEGVITTRVTDHNELEVLLTMFGSKDVELGWQNALHGLAIGEAALLPGIEEAGEGLRRFNLIPRMTSHVRHRNKYFDVPMSSNLAFVFTSDDKPTGSSARTLKELVSSVLSLPVEVVAGHARRGDFSHWIAGVLHDAPLALAVRRVERRFSLGELEALQMALVKPIQERYESAPAWADADQGPSQDVMNAGPQTGDGSRLTPRIHTQNAAPEGSAAATGLAT